MTYESKPIWRCAGRKYHAIALIKITKALDLLWLIRGEYGQQAVQRETSGGYAEGMASAANAGEKNAAASVPCCRMKTDWAAKGEE